LAELSDQQYMGVYASYPHRSRLGVAGAIGSIYKCALALDAEIVQLDLSLPPMIDLRPATADEMISTFLRGEIDSPEWTDCYTNALARRHADRTQVIDHGNSTDAQQSAVRRLVLYECRGGLFRSFPNDTAWRLVTVSPTEVSDFKFMNFDVWRRLTSTRLVSHGVQNLPQAQGLAGKVNAIAARLRQGDTFQPLIAAQCDDRPDVVLMDGHHRATAYALSGLPNEIDVYIGRSPHMTGWHWF
jgi:hypothetical protein